jgi:predicted regulator of Ras-like GTPase activity (Roadblock/LC7/MglB family)
MEADMDDQLLKLLDYDGVLGVLATTPDGLVVAAVGVEGDDAEIVGAAGSTIEPAAIASGSRSGSIEVSSASVHLLRGDDLSLVALTETFVPHDALAEVMQERLDAVAGIFA